MRVVGAGNAVGGPARVRDTDPRRHRFGLEQGLQVAHLALGAAPLQARLLQHRQTGRVIAAVLQRVQAGDQDGCHVALGDGSDDSTHG